MAVFNNLFTKLYPQLVAWLGADGETPYTATPTTPLPVVNGAIQSTNNSTTTPLASGATYTGTGETSVEPEVGCSCYSDTAGTLYFQFQNPGSSLWFTFPTAGFAVAAGVHEFHTALKLGRKFRVKFENSASPQSVLELYTYFGSSFGQGNAPIGFTISSDADARVVKAVISGIGDTTASVTDHQALQVTNPQEGKSAFGEVSVAQPTPVIHIGFACDTNPAIVDSFVNGSGTFTQANRMATLQTTAAANARAEFRSKRLLKYNPGQGAMARFTAVFTAGVANSTQIIGIGNESDGFFFGYNGTAFGIMRRFDGKPEIQTLTVSTKSSTAENITITLNGNTKAVAVTNGANATVTANEIAAADYSNVGTGWKARALGNKVEFKAYVAETKGGAFTLSGASTAVGTFAQNVVGTAPTETWTAQTAWNGADIFDGAGVTGVTLDPTKGNVYQIRYQWLGFGLITFYVEDPDDGEMHTVHSIEYANANTTPSIGDPSLSLMARAANTSNATNVTLKTPSMAAFIEGATELIGYRTGISNTKTTVTSSLLPILSVRQGQYRNSQAVQTFSKILRAAIAVEHTKPITIKIIENGTLVAASWADLETGFTALQYDTSATSITGGRETFSIPMGKASSTIADFVADYYAYNITPGRVLTFAAIANSGTNGEVSVGLKLLERL